MIEHISIKPKVTLRNWLREKTDATKEILSAFDAECEEITCECSTVEYLKNGELFMNVKKHQVFLNDKEVKIPPKQFALLEYIFRRKGQAISYIEILHHIWGDEYTADLQYVRVLTYELRVAFDDQQQRIIETVPHFGLRMNILPE